MDLFNILGAWWLFRRLYPAEQVELAGGRAYLREQLALLGPWSAAEKKAAVWIVVAVGLWSTDFVHHINPSLVGLGVGLAAALPGVGVLTQEQLVDARSRPLRSRQGSRVRARRIQANRTGGRACPLTEWRQ